MATARSDEADINTRLSKTQRAQAFADQQERRPTLFPSYWLLGIRVDDVDPDRLVVELVRTMIQGERLLMFHVNAWLLQLSDDRPWLRQVLLDADIVYVDGVGAQLATKILSRKSVTRCTAPEWIEDLGRLMAKEGRSVFWLGSSDEVIAQAARRFEEATGVKTAGWHHGFFEKKLGSVENRRVVEYVNGSGADLLIVNMGMPLQEQWLSENWPDLKVKVAFAAGALADRTAGLVDRPPAWVSSCGLEWLTRLVAEPRRLWRRYLIGLPILAGRIVIELASGSRVRDIQPESTSDRKMNSR